MCACSGDVLAAVRFKGLDVCLGRGEVSGLQGIALCLNCNYLVFRGRSSLFSASISKNLHHFNVALHGTQITSVNMNRPEVQSLIYYKNVRFEILAAAIRGRKANAIFLIHSASY